MEKEVSPIFFSFSFFLSSLSLFFFVLCFFNIFILIVITAQTTIIQGTVVLSANVNATQISGLSGSLSFGMREREWGVGSGEWGVGSGEWGGEWGVGSGEWGVRSGEWGVRREE